MPRRPAAFPPVQIEMAVTELDMITDVFNRLVNSCHAKCISEKYLEGDLNKGEGVCIDRCTAKFFEVSHAARTRRVGWILCVFDPIPFVCLDVDIVIVVAVRRPACTLAMTIPRSWTVRAGSHFLASTEPKPIPSLPNQTHPPS